MRKTLIVERFARSCLELVALNGAEGAKGAKCAKGVAMSVKKLAESVERKLSERVANLCMSVGAAGPGTQSLDEIRERGHGRKRDADLGEDKKNQSQNENVHIMEKSVGDKAKKMRKQIFQVNEEMSQLLCDVKEWQMQKSKSLND